MINSKSLPKIISMDFCNSFTRLPSSNLVSITITGTFCSQTIRQKSRTVSGRGPANERISNIIFNQIAILINHSHNSLLNSLMNIDDVRWHSCGRNDKKQPKTEKSYGKSFTGKFLHDQPTYFASIFRGEFRTHSNIYDESFHENS